MMPKAFIIMPFDPSMKDIDVSFIRPILESIGYEVKRADDIQSGQNILDDVINGIHEANLVVAVLTGNNANVFYEIGIAHSLNKPTILLSEQIDKVPFDLQSYRTLGYNTYFTKMPEAINQLTELATGALKGEIPFSSPVHDFYLRNPKLQKAIITPSGKTKDVSKAKKDAKIEADDEKQLFDFLADVEESLEDITSILTESATETENLGSEIESTAGALQTSTKLKARRDTLKSLAGTMQIYYDKLSENNLLLPKKLATFESGMVGFLDYAREHKDQLSKSELSVFVETQENLKSSIAVARQSLQDLISNLSIVPKIQTHLDRSIEATIQELLILLDYFEQLESIVNRIISLGKGM